MVADSKVTPAMAAKAQVLLSERLRWQRGRRKSDGRRFWLMPSSDGRTGYYVAIDGAGCSCRSYLYRGVCSHSEAARIDADERYARCLLCSADRSLSAVLAGQLCPCLATVPA